MTNFATYRGPKLGDFYAVCTRLPVDEREQYEALTGSTFDVERVAAEYSLRTGPAWVFTAGGTPLVVTGFDMQRPGVWQTWFFAAPEAWAQYGRHVTRTSRHLMDAMLQSGAHRLQCVSLASRVRAHRWYRTLGLELEGPLRAYGAKGEDALMFSRLRVPDNVL